MADYEYQSTDDEPSIPLLWKDGNDAIIDFSSGYTFTVMLAVNGSAYLTKTTGVMGAATDPNILVTWTAGELNIPPNTYDLLVTARDGAGKDRTFRPGNPPKVQIIAAPSQGTFNTVGGAGDVVWWSRFTTPQTIGSGATATLVSYETPALADAPGTGMTFDAATGIVSWLRDGVASIYAFVSAPAAAPYTVDGELDCIVQIDNAANGLTHYIEAIGVGDGVRSRCTLNPSGSLWLPGGATIKLRLGNTVGSTVTIDYVEFKVQRES